MGRIALCLLFAFAGCRSTETAREEVRPVSSTLVAPSSSAPAGNARIADCRVTESLRTNSGGDSLENVRVWVDGNQTIVTSERVSTPQYGDSAGSGHVTWIDWTRPPKERAREVMLPYRAYASAMYTRVGATRDGLFAYGVAGDAEFGLFPQGHAAWKALNPHQDDALPTRDRLVLNFVVTGSFSVAPERAIAAVAGLETSCPLGYCDDVILPTSPPPLRSVRLVSLERPARSHLVWSARLPKLDQPLAPAIALGKDAGAIAFRAENEILLARFGADLKPKTPEKLAVGDVGAPAILFRNAEPIVAWAERASQNDPYRIHLLVDGKRHELRAGSESAFAPSIALFEDQLLVAFMQGNTGTSGKIRLARIPLAALGDVVDVSTAADLSPGSVNARDPDLAVSRAGAVVAWSEFPKNAMSRVEVRRLDCKNP